VQNDALPMAIRRKYGLVHVPRLSRCERWVETCRAHLTEGIPPERAGLLAAREVFPYEAREIFAPDAGAVTELLNGAGSYKRHEID